MTNPSSSAKSPLAPFLLAAGEEAGFPPNARATNYTSAENFAAFSQETGGGTRLKSEGFEDAVIESLGESNSGSGTSSVTEFATASGAVAEGKAQIDQIDAQAGGVSIHHFTVPGVSSAQGVVLDSGGSVGTNVFWVEGRCLMSLGNSAGVSLQSKVVAGVQSVHRRTHGSCP